MAKILVGSFQCESNTFAAHMAHTDSFLKLSGEEVVERLAGCRVLKAAGFECVPLRYMVSLPAGMVCKEDYLQMLEAFLEEAKKHTDAVGVYIYFHGAMYVEQLESGEEYFVRRLREVIGPDMPIAIASDFHSNISDGLLENINAISGYRTAPHTDYDETEYRACNALVSIIQKKLSTKVKVFRVPAFLADAAQTAREPYRTALTMLEKLDQMEGVVTAALYNGQPWVDAPYVGISVVVAYSCNENAVCQAGQALADYIRENLDKFAFEVPAMLPDAALEAAKTMPKPVFISDSGDNTTAGADGCSSFFLEKILENTPGRVLVATICRKELFDKIADKQIGETVDLEVEAQDIYSKGCRLQGTVKQRGTILGFVNEEAGEGVVVSCKNCDVVVSDVRTSFITEEHFSAMQLDASEYDCVVLKIGYLWPRTAPLAASQIFALTPGVSTNDFSTLHYKNLKNNYFYVK